MNGLYQHSQQKRNIKLYLPESFEWIILKSGIVPGKDVTEILEKPEEYIDSKEYFSWERYFTKLLTEKTEDTFLKYRKRKLNKAYLHDKNKRAILREIKGIEI